MLSKKNRLDTPSVQAIKKNHHHLSVPAFHIDYFPNHLQHSRVSVVISKKVFKLASDRNILKRRILFAIKHHFDLSLPLDLIIYVKQQKFIHSQTNLVSAITQINHQLKLTQTHSQTP